LLIWGSLPALWGGEKERSNGEGTEGNNGIQSRRTKVSTMDPEAICLFRKAEELATQHQKAMRDDEERKRKQGGGDRRRKGGKSV